MTIVRPSVAWMNIMKNIAAEKCRVMLFIVRMNAAVKFCAVNYKRIYERCRTLDEVRHLSYDGIIWMLMLTGSSFENHP